MSGGGHYGWTADMDATLRRMWGAGHTIEDICKAVDRVSANVRNRRIRLGLPARPPGWKSDAAVAVPAGFALSVVHTICSPQKVDRARVLLAKRRDPFAVHAATKLPLRECYRLQAEMAGRV